MSASRICAIAAGTLTFWAASGVPPITRAAMSRRFIMLSGGW